MARAFEVYRARGHALVEDQNGGWADGIMRATATLDEAGQRASAATCYLTPEVRARANLRVLTGARAARLVLDGAAVTGAEVETPEGLVSVTAGETVLACGAIGTPALMLRSGIGPGAESGGAGDRRGA